MGDCATSFIAARQWLNSHDDDNTFLFIHFMDPHIPYAPPEPFTHMFDPDYHGRFRDKFMPGELQAWRDGEMNFSEPEIEHIGALYDAEIAYYDSVFASFMQYLDENGIADNSLVIFTSDHGEEFKEHGGLEHGHSLYDEVIHVPLIIKGKDYPRGIITGRTVSTIDIFPTILDYLAIPIPDNLDGLSLLRPVPADERLLIAEQVLYGDELKSVTTSQYRYIFHAVTGEDELYEIAEDPLMLNSVSDDRRAVARSFRDYLTEYALSRGTPWHLFFMRKTGENTGAQYSGTVTCKGGFADVKPMRFDDGDTFDVHGDTMHFEVTLKSSSEKEIRFVTNDEAAKAGFKLSRDALPMSDGDIFIGPALDEITGPEFSIDISDPRLGLSGPRLLRRDNDGVFIWAIPRRIREKMQPELTAEEEEDLRSVGYLN